MTYGRNHDFLSNLPLGVIHTILSRIPLKDAIRTCILSTQWKNKWTTLPHLGFSEYYSNGAIVDFNECLENFITHVLNRHVGSLEKFEIGLPLRINFQKFDEWILCLSRKDIRELSMFINYGQNSSYEMHSSIYSCRNLTHLDLLNFTFNPPPPSFKGFLFLKVLHLRNVNMYPQGIETVFANSPLLERLHLLDSKSTELHINAPNLKYLYLRGPYVKICLHAPLLAEMFVELYDNNFRSEHPPQNSSVCNYTDFLGRFPNLEKLIGDFYILKYLSVGIESCQLSLVFPHLKLIQLTEVNFQSIREMLVLGRLVLGAPNLEKLILGNLYCTNRVLYPNPENVSLMDVRSGLNMRFEKLREVKFSGVTGGQLEMELIKFLLESSPVLEVMRFEKIGGIMDEQRQVLMAELMGWTCVSPVVNFSFN